MYSITAKKSLSRSQTKTGAIPENEYKMLGCQLSAFLITIRGEHFRCNPANPFSLRKRPKMSANQPQGNVKAAEEKQPRLPIQIWSDVKNHVQVVNRRIPERLQTHFEIFHFHKTPSIILGPP